MTNEEAREELLDMKRDVVADSWRDKALDLAIKALVQQSRTGHWSRKTKVDAYDIAGVKTWGIKCQCDRCNFTTIVVEDFGYYKYCPNCGTKMEVEK